MYHAVFSPERKDFLRNTWLLGIIYREENPRTNPTILLQ
jgi:hypothetical protein